VRSAAFDPGDAPVDVDRVAEIRKAVEQGHYPVIPARVADAMIAAGLLLRTGK
jgi:negative regulator of flagellin synthesis FlgM